LGIMKKVGYITTNNRKRNIYPLLILIFYEKFEKEMSDFKEKIDYKYKYKNRRKGGYLNGEGN